MTLSESPEGLPTYATGMSCLGGGSGHCHCGLISCFSNGWWMVEVEMFHSVQHIFSLHWSYFRVSLQTYMTHSFSHRQPTPHS